MAFEAKVSKENRRGRILLVLSSRWRVCVTCGKEFLAKRSSQLYCGTGCRKELRWKRRSWNLRLSCPINWRECRLCWKAFIVHRSFQRFCSDACRKYYFAIKHIYGKKRTEYLSRVRPRQRLPMFLYAKDSSLSVV